MSRHVFFDPDKQVALRDTNLARPLINILRYAFSIKSLYEMQALTLRHFEDGDRRCVSFNDMILCAPTGSGKTLAYALPIVQSIHRRCTLQHLPNVVESVPTHQFSQPRIRAVVVVPTRDLAQQVAHVFRTLFICTKFSNKKVDVDETVEDAGAETEEDDDDGGDDEDDDYNTSSIDDDEDDSETHDDKFDDVDNINSCVALVTGASSVAKEARSLQCPQCEVIVATPGRLVHHVRHTTGVSESLSSVQYLVLDESDRLLQESYDQWLSAITPHIGQPPSSSAQLKSSNSNQLYRPSSGLFALSIVPAIASAAGSDFKTALSDTRVRKILVSATQSHNPMHMVHLDMRYPTIFRSQLSSVQKKGVKDDEKESSTRADDEDDRYTVPSTLHETGHVIKNIEQKPAALLHLLGWTDSVNQRPLKRKRSNSEDKHGFNISNSNGVKLVFTNSIESAHRLCRLLELCTYALHPRNRIPVFEMSAELSAERREQVVAMLKECQIANGQPEKPSPVIVCSDVLSRGMDIFTVDHVINYDAPVHVRTYLHRSGRTARAGRHGLVSTLLLAKQVHHFRRMVHDADRGGRQVQTFNMRADQFLTPAVHEMFSFTLTALKRVLNRERLNLIFKEAPIPAHTLFELQRRYEDDQTNNDECTERGLQNSNQSNMKNEQETDYQTYDSSDRKRNYEEGNDESEYYHEQDEQFREEPQTEPMDDEARWARIDIEQGVDGINTLIYAQIANNCLAS